MSVDAVDDLDKGAAAAELRAELASLRARIWGERIVYAPIRHHSPACARQVARLIRDRRPATILIEGPAEFTPLIPLLLSPDTRCPIAIYGLHEGEAAPGQTVADRHAAYYPFCDYSPELVALREGAKIGARLAFVDLGFAAQAERDRRWEADAEGEAARSLMEEGHLRRSRYVQALARRVGCRDHDELWDHLFELPPGRSPRDFFFDVAAFCHMARRDYDAAALEADGTAAREQAMAAVIREALAAGDGDILVVTGGFHTPALPDLVEDETPIRDKAPGRAAQAYLIRYAFDRLDALNGYASGMRAPAFYQRVWESAPDPADEPDWHAVAAATLIDFAADSRGPRTHASGAPQRLSTPDAAAALSQAKLLARLRGHAGPGREDVLDGVRSAYVKGALDAEGAPVMAAIRRVLAGDAIGDVPGDAGQPPLIADARRRATELKLDLSGVLPRAASLDIYRDAGDLERSRFFHAMAYLEAPFAQLTAGPDFVRGRGLDLLIEKWSYAWSPSVEARLIDRAALGATVEEACLRRLRQESDRLQDQGEGRSASAAVRLLIAACRMGLVPRLPALTPLIAAQIDEDPELSSVASALRSMALLWRVRRPLGAIGVDDLPNLMLAAYRRACFLTPELRGVAEGAIPAALGALRDLREFVAGGDGRIAALDAELFLGAVQALADAPDAAPTMIGAAAGVLWTERRLDDQGLARLAVGMLRGAVGDNVRTVGFLRGLTAMAREALWSCDAMVEELNRAVAEWDDATFLKALPDLRLAFAELAPHEIEALAARFAAANGAEGLGALLSYEIDDAEAAFGVRLAGALERELAAQGLAAWGRA